MEELVVGIMYIHRKIKFYCCNFVTKKRNGIINFCNHFDDETKFRVSREAFQLPFMPKIYEVPF